MHVIRMKKPLETSVINIVVVKQANKGFEKCCLHITCIIGKYLSSMPFALVLSWCEYRSTFNTS